MGKAYIVTTEVTYINRKIYAVKVLYLIGGWRYYKAPHIPKSVVDYVRFWSPEMPYSAFGQDKGGSNG